MEEDLNQQIDYKKLFIESLKKFPNNKKWSTGDFIGIKTVSNTNVGNVGEDFMLNYCDALGLEVKNLLLEPLGILKQTELLMN